MVEFASSRPSPSGDLLRPANAAESALELPEGLLADYRRATQRLLEYTQQRRAEAAHATGMLPASPDVLAVLEAIKGAVPDLPHILIDERLMGASAQDVLKAAREATRTPIALTFLTAALDEYEKAFLKSVLATKLPALVRAARQSNAEERIEKLLKAIAPDDPIAKFDLQMAEETTALRQEFLAEHKPLTSKEVSARANFSSSNAYQAVHRWKSDGKIFSIKHDGRELYPPFQFDDDGRPKPIIRELLKIFARYPARTDWDNALWFAAENDWLDGATPIELLDSEPELVKDAALQAVLPHVE